MKKFFLMLAVVAGCTVFTSCKSDAEKAAQLTYDAAHAESIEEATKLAAEAEEIVDANKDNEDFVKEYTEALAKLNEAK